MRSRLKTVLVTVLGLGLAACVSRGEVEELKNNQQEILKKLDEVAKGGGRPAPQQPQRPQGPDPSKVYAFPAGNSATKGPADAWVTIIEVSEFQCPFCKRVLPTLNQIKEKYGDDVRIVFKHNPLPFHNRAMPAAVAAECAKEQGKFWEMHDAMFENQRALEDADLEKYAKESGLDMGKWQSCYKEERHKNDILQDQRTASSLGARGTPAFFINGRFLSGAQPFPAFQSIIDEELKKAKESGISKKDYYTKAVLEKGEKKL